MENLVGRKVKYIDDNEFMYFGKKESYEIECQDIKHFYLIDDHGIRNAIENNSLYDYFELIDEPQFKQGDKVLVSNDRQKWHDRVFVVEHNNLYQCEPLHENISNTLTPWQHIKPYEEGIKVGDWVKRISDETIWKIRDKEDVNVALNSECTKITNPQLIILLNNEL